MFLYSAVKMVTIYSLTYHAVEPWAKHYLHIRSMNGSYDEIMKWCNDTLVGKWKVMPDEYWPTHIYIELEHDAMMIRLRW